MTDLMAAFEVAHGHGSRVAFRLKDGTNFEGYIDDIGERGVRCTSGGPMGGWSHTFSFDRIEPSSLWYGEEESRQYPTVPDRPPYESTPSEDERADG